MDDHATKFADRAAAGRLLGARLAGLTIARPVVYALPRGGVPVALEVARALDAPLDLIMVRKIGAPGAPELALGAVADGDEARSMVNEDVRAAYGATASFLERGRRRELAEIERRRAVFLQGRPRIEAQGRTAIIVDDGLATGATAKVALAAIKRRGAARTILAVPVAPQATLVEMRGHADDVICLQPEEFFTGVGAFYRDFHQLTDEETTGLLRQAWAGGNDPSPSGARDDRRAVQIPPLGLHGDLCVPPAARGIVVFAHGSGSGRFSPRNIMVAEALNRRGFATLLLDLLTEREARDRRCVFDIALLAGRLAETSLWISGEPELNRLDLGFFGASTGAGAALLAAAELRGRVRAVVSRGGRPDLAGPALSRVESPTLLIVGGEDTQLIALNRGALAALGCEKRMEIVPRAGHLFEEPGALETVTELAAGWFGQYLTAPGHARSRAAEGDGRGGAAARGGGAAASARG